MSTEAKRPKVGEEPKPGEVGGAMVGYAEAMRQQETHEPVEVHASKDEATKAFEKASGKKIGEMTEEDFYRLPIQLSAKNMQNMTELHVVFKDPSMTGRWFNYKTKTEDRVARAFMQGFTACTREDVEACHIKQTDENGALVYGDLVLLKIPKAVLWGGYYKRNMDTAVSRVERAAKKNPQFEKGGLPEDGIARGPMFEGEFKSVQTADVDYRQADSARDLVYAE